MRVWAEIGGFLVLSAGLHLGLAALGPPLAGAQAAGDGGSAVITLAASSANLAGLVEDWDRPPETAVTAAAPPLPGTDRAPGIASTPDVAQKRLPLAMLSAAAPDAPALAPEAPLAVPRMTQPATPNAPQPDGMPDAKQPDPRAADAMPIPVEDPRPARVAPALTEARADTPPAQDTTPAPAPLRPRAKPARSAGAESIAQQRASGKGGNALAGQTGKDQSVVAGDATAAKQQLAHWGGQIRNRIERRKRYPLAAAGASGSVNLLLRIAGDGRLLSVQVTGMSGNAALDQAAVAAVHAVGRFPQAPEGLRDQAHSLSLPVTFTR